MRMPQPRSGPIPVPDDFPLCWGAPEEAHLFWAWDQMHHPKPVTPLTGCLDAPAMAAGFTKGARAHSLPVKAFKCDVFNCYWYISILPLDSIQEAAARLLQLQGHIMEASARALDDWETAYLPEVTQLNQRICEYPYGESDTRKLLDFLDEARAIRERQFEIHNLVVLPVMMAATTFLQWYEATFGPPENNEHYQMLGGFPNKTVETGQALFELATEAPASVAQTIRNVPGTELLAELDKSAAGRDFRARLEAYLDHYGWRSDAFEFMDPSWREDPTPVLHTLKSYLRPGALDPGQEQAKAAAACQHLIAQTEERLSGNEAQLSLFRRMLRSAQAYLPIQENHNFYIDQANTVLMRLPIRELGHRLLAAGVSDALDDVFFLTDGEIRDLLTSPDSRKSRELIHRRRSEHHRWSRVVPPPFLGTAPPAESPGADPLLRFFGGDLVEGSRDPKIVTGVGASKGVARGKAKVVRTLSEADKVEPGDILVCEMSMPAWTPLFSIVCAVVADSGGVLSHCAIVAREYGIPCVVGTIVGTQRIRDGQGLTVDGAKGVVRIDG